MLAVGAIAVIALHHQDFLRDVDRLRYRAKTHEVRDARKGLQLVVRHAQPAADRHVEAGEFALGVGDCDVAQIVAVDVHVVARRDGDDNFEFPRQVGLAVDRFRLGLAAGDEFIADPQFVVGARTRQEMGADRLRDVVNLGVQRRLIGIRIAHHVAVHVAARGDGVEQRPVHTVDRAPEIALENAVKLERLARGEFQRAVGVLVGEGVEGQPLGGRADAAGNADPRHEAEGLFLALLAPLVAEIAVVLRVDPVKFGELAAVLGDASGGGVGQVAQDVAAEKITPGLEVLVFMERLFRGGNRDGVRRGAHTAAWSGRWASVSRSAVASASTARGCVPTSWVKWQRSGLAARFSAACPIRARSP